MNKFTGIMLFILILLIIGILATLHKMYEAAANKEPVAIYYVIDRTITSDASEALNSATTYPTKEQALREIPLSETLQEQIYDLCVKYDILEHYFLVIALIQIESSYRADVISETSDYGLMQINSINHSWLSEELDITNFLMPLQNVTAGIHMLSDYLHKYDCEHQALMAYNQGEYGASLSWEKGYYTSTYSEKVLEAELLLIQR